MKKCSKTFTIGMFIVCALVLVWFLQKAQAAQDNYLSVEQATAIYEDIYKDNPNAGFQITDEESDAISQAGGAPTYGEITWKSALTLLQDPDLNVTANDIFYDLGSGIGKLCIAAYLASPVKKSIGIELSGTRFNHAQQAKKALTNKLTYLQRWWTLRKKSLTFTKENILTAPFEDATIIYMCSTCYEPMMAALTQRFTCLPNGVRIISLKSLPENPHIKLITELTLPVTWKKAGSIVRIYKIEHPQ